MDMKREYTTITGCRPMNEVLSAASSHKKSEQNFTLSQMQVPAKSL